LVLPPHVNHDARMGAARLEEYFSLEDMRKGLDVLTYEEFTAPGMPGEKLGLDYRPEGGGTSIEDIAFTLRKDMVKPDWNIEHHFWCYPSCPKPGSGANWDRLDAFRVTRKGHVDMAALGEQQLRSQPGKRVKADAAEVFHIDSNILFGNYYSLIWVEDEALYTQLRWTVRACVRFRDEFHVKAAEVVKRLGGMGKFNAIHLRRDDWWALMGSIQFDPSGLAARAKQMPKHDTLYVAVKFKTKHVRFDDGKSVDQRQIFMRKEKPMLTEATRSRIVTSEEFFCNAHERGCEEAQKAKELRFVTPPPLATSCVDWTAVVEMLVCAQAANMMGTAKSTYTNGIARMHGYYHQVAPTFIMPNRLFYVDEPIRDWWLEPGTALDRPTWKGGGSTDDVGEYTWFHEWPEAWLGELKEQRAAP